VEGFFRLVKEIKEKKFDKIFIFNGSIKFFFLAKLVGIKSINQYPLFIRKDNIVLTAKKFTEKFTEADVLFNLICFLVKTK